MDENMSVQQSYNETSLNSQENINTLYIRNLNEKVSKEKLRKTITDLLSENRLPVKQLKLFKNLQLRGQAFVTLYSHEDCLRAIDTLDTKIVYDKPMDIYFAKSNSDAGVEEVVSQKEGDQAEAVFEGYIQDQKAKRLENRATKRRTTPENRGQKKQKVSGANGKANLEPNRILLLTNLPESVLESDILGIFEKYPGFLNLNLVGIRNLALIEFRSELDSKHCLEELGNTFTIKETEAFLQFAKK